MALPDSFMGGRVREVDGLEIIGNGFLVFLDGGDGVAGLASGKIPRGPVPGMHRIRGDDASGHVGITGKPAHGRDFVALPFSPGLPEHHAGPGPGRDGDRQHGPGRVAPAARPAASGHLAQTPGQAARKAARQFQGAPVRGAVAGAREPRDVDERLSEEDRVPMRRGHIRGQPPQAGPERAGGQVRHAPVGQDSETGIVADQVQPPELPVRRPADPAVAHRQSDAPGGQPTGASQIPPCSATWCRPGPTMP